MGSDGKIDGLVLRIVKALVDKQNEVSVEAVTSDTVVIYRVTVAADDVGKLIAKQGRTARAIRVLLTAMESEQRVSLDIVEDRKS
jgi:predicted RNA-binding protein YlqC (UPF0109 family)